MDSFTLAVVIGMGVVIGLFLMLVVMDRSNAARKDTPSSTK